MIAVTVEPDKRLTWGLFGSLVLHALLWLAFMLPGRVLYLPRLEEGLPVEVWTSDEFDAVSNAQVPEPATAAPTIGTVPSATEPDRSPVAVPAPLSLPTPPIGSLIRAHKILSSGVLNDPLSRQAKAMLPMLEQKTRLEQLCGIEAMAQIAEWHRQFRPDRVVAYALANLKISWSKIIAEGAAFRSEQRWYRLRFTCDLVPGRDEVRAFEFAVGDAIPRSAWERYGLPPVY